MSKKLKGVRHLMRQHVVAALCAIVIGGALLVPAAAAPDQTQGMALLSAAVSADGTLLGGAGAVSSELVAGGQTGGEGFYRVVFNRSVVGCVRVATVGRFASPGFTTGTATTAIDPDGRVQVFTGKFVREVQLLVFCAQ